jgi:hypothetical protein
MPFPSQLELGAPVGTTAGWVLGQLAVNYATDADLTLTSSGSSPQSTNNALQVASSVSLTATRKLIVPLSFGQQYTVQNNTTGGEAIEIIGPSGTGVLVPNGATLSVVCDGTNYNPQTGGTTTPGQVFAIRIPVGLATVASAASVPLNAVVLRSFFDATTAYSVGATVELGTAASPSLFQTVAPQSIDLYDNPQDTVNGTADPLLVTVTGTPSVGAGFACVEYVIPLT